MIDFFKEFYRFFLEAPLLIEIGMVFLSIVFSLVVIGIFYLISDYLFKVTKYSEMLRTRAVVVAKQYSAEENDINTGMGIGYSKDGPVMMPIISSSHKAESFKIVFKSKKIGKITLDDDDIYEFVREGQTVFLEYREKYTKYFWQNDDKYVCDDYDVDSVSLS